MARQINGVRCPRCEFDVASLAEHDCPGPAFDPPEPPPNWFAGACPV